MTDIAATQWLDRLAGALVMLDDQDDAAWKDWAEDLLQFADACDLPSATAADCRSLVASLGNGRPQAMDSASQMVESLQAYLRENPVAVVKPAGAPCTSAPPTAGDPAPSLPDTKAPPDGARARPGLYLTFCLAGEQYGVEILKVQEIIQLMKVTRMPYTPAYVRGVISLRDRVYPVIDLCLKLNLPPTEDTENSCIILAQMTKEAHKCTMGFVVDGVSEVLRIDEGQIDPPTFGMNSGNALILGVARVGSNVIMLLDIERVLTGDEMTAISRR